MSGADIRCLTMTAADLPEVWNIERFFPGPWDTDSWSRFGGI